MHRQLAYQSDTVISMENPNEKPIHLFFLPTFENYNPPSLCSQDAGNCPLKSFIPRNLPVGRERGGMEMGMGVFSPLRSHFIDDTRLQKEPNEN